MEPRKNNVFECSAVTKGVEIELTNYCGMDCMVCPRKQLSEYGFLSEENFRHILDLVKQGHYEEIMVCGLGDGFLHPQLCEFMDILFKELPHINLFFMTKGGAITDAHLQKISQLKQKGYNVSLTFSVFSLDEKIYNFLTGGSFYKKFMETLHKAHEMKVNYSLEFMLSVLTLSELPKFKSFAQGLQKDFGISLVHNWGGNIGTNIHKKMFDETILKNHYITRPKGDVCEVMKYDYLYFDCFGDVFQCSLNSLTRYGLLGHLGDHDLHTFLSKKHALDYQKACQNCFYAKYKTFS